MRRLVLVIAVVAACSGTTVSPSPTVVLTLAQAADAYGVVATAANDAMDAASKNMSGTPELVQAYCRTRVDIERTFVAGLDDIAFPPELVRLVATLRASDGQLIAEMQACIGATGREILKAVERESLIEASRATSAAAMSLRAELGLPTTKPDSLGYFH